MSDSNTAPKQPSPGKPFTKADPRINRKGRPKSFDAVRALAQDIAHEEARTKDQAPVVINGKIVTTTEIILRQWAASRDPKIQQMFLDWAYGKVPTVVTGEDGGPVRIEYIIPHIADSTDGETG